MARILGYVAAILANFDPMATNDGEPHVIDGGELGCGELLLLVLREIKSVDIGRTVRIVTTDPAAPIDIPAWCHLTGHSYLGTTRHDERPAYDLILMRRHQPAGNPWSHAHSDEPTSTHSHIIGAS